MDLNITKLPKEVLSLIFERLVEANDRRRAAQVNKLFYAILRHQSMLKQDNVLRMAKTEDSKKFPIRVFENSGFFPFSKLCIEDWHRNVVLESTFWALHGHKISELLIFVEEIDVNIQTFLSTLSVYFPNLKKLKFGTKFSNADNNPQQIQISFPIEDLIINTEEEDMPLDQIIAFFRACPLLKNLTIKLNHEKQLPQILPWLETIESSRLAFPETQLGKLIIIPNKVVIGGLSIKVNENPKSIREFFKNRTIKHLCLYSKEYEEEEDNPARIYFTRDQTLALEAAKAIKNVDLCEGVLEFEGSLDLLAKLPGLENIILWITKDLPIPLYPFYWSLPETAQTIRTIYISKSNLDNLTGLSSVTSINIFTYQGLSSNEIQALIRNCPNLQKLVVNKIDATDADLIGHGDLLPFSSLEKLESLIIRAAPNITLEAFKSAFNFPNLKSFTLWNYNSSEEQPFNQHVAKLFTQNCPNLEDLEICNCPINEEGFDYLIRYLPYLRFVRILTKGERHSLSVDKVEEMQQEFPYIKISIDED